MSTRQWTIRIVTVSAIMLLLLQGVTVIADAFSDGPLPQKKVAAIIDCTGMIDEGLYKSIQRRSREAIEDGATHLIFKVGTYGGRVDSADLISKYMILELASQVHTIAYVDTEAISAGAMISVSCQDIIMRNNTSIGDSAPIIMGGKLEGVEREKTESFIRAIFSRAAEANGYPEPLLLAMVTDSIKVYRIENIETGELEFFDGDILPQDPNVYALDSKELIVKEGQLLTVTANKALEYGISRATVEDVNEAMSFIETRDGISFAGKPRVYETTWSEKMVRMVNHPSVTGVLFMIAMLGVYIEFKTPGIGLAGGVALICFAIVFGSRFLWDLANWIEVAIFLVGIVLLIIEFFFIPGFGFAGGLGILCILAGFVGMLVKNPPDKLPIPVTPFDWMDLQNGVIAISLGFVGFVIIAWLLSKVLPKVEMFSGVMLRPTKSKIVNPVSATSEIQNVDIKAGDTGRAITNLHPAGRARFADVVVDVVTDGRFIDIDKDIEILGIIGNRVVVKEKS